MGANGTKGARTRDGAPETLALNARLVPRIDTALPDTPIAASPASLDDVPASPRKGRAPAVTALPHPAQRPAATAVEGEPGLPRADENTYYPVQQVDVYPSLVSPLSIGSLEQGAAVGRVLMLVSIDESGGVRAAVLIEGGPPTLEAAMRSVLLPARFTPALKNGRAVKSRVVLSVDYGVDAGANNLQKAP